MEPHDEGKGHPCSIDDLFVSRMPKEVVDAVNNIELRIEQWQEIEANKPQFRITATDREVVIHIKLKKSVRTATIKKWLLGLSSVSGIGGVTAWIVRHFS
jgi:hypothetical protein